MIWLIIALVAAIVCIVAIVRDKDVMGPVFGGFVITLLLCGTAFMLNAVCNLLLSFTVDTQWTVSHTRNITALNDATSVSVRFFLGSGRVEDEMRYYFIEETEKGKELDSISAENAFIIEADTETPRIEKWTREWANKDLMFWFTIFPPSGSEYKIYIPKNSVTTNFSIDLQSGTLTPGTTTNNPTTPPTTNHCAHCNHTLSETDNFCPSCGTPATPPTTYCSNCGREANEGENYCPNCGTKLHGSE